MTGWMWRSKWSPGCEGSSLSHTCSEKAHLIAKLSCRERYTPGNMAAVNAVRTFSEDLQIPSSLGQLGFKDTDIPILVDGVMKVTRLPANNPRILTKPDAEEIYRKVLQQGGAYSPCKDRNHRSRS